QGFSQLNAFLPGGWAQSDAIYETAQRFRLAQSGGGVLVTVKNGPARARRDALAAVVPPRDVRRRGDGSGVCSGGATGQSGDCPQRQHDLDNGGDKRRV